MKLFDLPCRNTEICPPWKSCLECEWRVCVSSTDALVVCFYLFFLSLFHCCVIFDVRLSQRIKLLDFTKITFVILTGKSNVWQHTRSQLVGFESDRELMGVKRLVDLAETSILGQPYQWNPCIQVTPIRTNPQYWPSWPFAAAAVRVVTLIQVYRQGGA